MMIHLYIIGAIKPVDRLCSHRNDRSSLNTIIIAQTHSEHNKIFILLCSIRKWFTKFSINPLSPQRLH